MAFPTTKIEIAFTGGPYLAAPTWTPVTTYVREISINRGRSSDFENFPPSTATLVLDNRDGRFNPLNTSGAYYPNVTPRCQIQITADTGSGYVPVFRGYIVGWPVSWTKYGADSTVTIQCMDALSLLANTNLVYDWSYSTILALNPIYWVRGNDVAGATTLQNIGSRTSQLTGPIALSTGLASTVTIIKQPTLAKGLPYESTVIYAGQKYTTTPFDGTAETAITLMGWFRFNDVPMTYSVIELNLFATTAYILIGGNGVLYCGSLRAGTSYYTNTTTGGYSGSVPHHVAMTMTGTTLKLYVDGIDVTGTVNTTFYGTTEQEKLSITSSQFQEIAGFNSALTQAQIQSVYNAGAAQFVETTGARTTRILATTALNSALYLVTTVPEGTVGEISIGGPVIPEIQKTSDSEGGDLYVSKAGVLTFTARSYAPTQGATASAATFTDTGSNNPYGGELDIQIDADSISNDITVVYSSGGNVRTSSTPSQNTNGVASDEIDTYLSNATEATSLANFELSTRSTVKPQVSAIEVSNTESSAHWVNILALELLSPITITRTPPTGSVFTQKMLVNAITHNITPSSWSTTLQGSARYAGWFVLDTSALDGPDFLL